MKSQLAKVEEQPQSKQQELQGQLPDEMQQEEEPPLNITKNIMGQRREYYYLKTVKSLEEMDQFRFQVYCQTKFITLEIILKFANFH
jgi:hypothetical protein